MAPSRDSCQTYLSAQSVKSKLLVEIATLKNVLSKSIKSKQDVNFGKLVPQDITSAAQQYSSSIDNLSINTAQKYIGNISNSSQEIFKSIFKQILILLLSSPQTLFSFVCIPREQAILYSNIENKYLLLALQNVRDIIDILLKILPSTRSDNPYYKIIELILPYIKDALSVLNNMTTFDAALYNRVKYDIEFSLNEINTGLNFKASSKLVNVLKADSDALYAVSEKKINDNYNKQKQALNNKYLSDLESCKTDKSLNEHQIRINYSEQLKILDTKRNDDLAKAKNEASRQASSSSSNFHNLLKSSGIEYPYYIRTLGLSIADLALNLKKAYEAYIRKQLLCNAIYNASALITNLVNEMLSLSQPNPTLMQSIASSVESYLGVVDNNFSADVNKFRTTHQTSVQDDVKDLITGRTLLLLADKEWNSLVTKELQGLLNVEDLLYDSSGQYNHFIKKIENIPDWNGSLNSWITLQSLVPPPYIQAIANVADITNLIGGNFKNKIQSYLFQIEQSIQEMIRHNNYVIEILLSYKPYAGPGLSELLKLLKASNLLETFSKNMSIITVLANITGDIASRAYNTNWPSYDSCKLAYPDLFNDSNLSKGAARSMADETPYGTHPETMEKVEQNMLERYALKLDVRTLDIDIATAE